MGEFIRVHAANRSNGQSRKPHRAVAPTAPQLRAGDRCYRVEDDDDGMPALFEAAYLGKGQGAYYFRHPFNGEHWSESGMHWYGRPQDALRAYINALVSMLNAPETWLRISDCSREDLFRRMVRACAQLDALDRA